MLRRKPTAITLTSEDLASYEERQAREALLEAQAQAQMQAQAQAQSQDRVIVTPQRGQNQDPNAELRHVHLEKPKKTREERLGISRRS
jgi:uncharacterized protein YggE